MKRSRTDGVTALIALASLLLVGCASDMDSFKYGDRIVSDGGRPGTVLDMADHIIQIEALVRWDDDPGHPEWKGFGLIRKIGKETDG